MTIKVSLIEDAKKAFGFSTFWVQYIAGGLVTTWVTMPDQYQTAILAELGLTPDRMILFGAFMWVASTMLARVTVVERKPPSSKP